jgi:PPP family 3-phenylpropionic acid transporter
MRLWGSAGFLLTVFAAGAWFDRFGMGSFPAWAAITLAGVFACTLMLPDAREEPSHGQAAREPVAPVLRRPEVRWFFASLFLHVMSHYAIYGFLSLYLDSLGYGKTMIGVLWAVSVVAEIAWFYLQGHFMPRRTIERWLLICALATFLRMALTGGLGASLLALFVAQALHALSFAAHHTCCIAMVTRHFPGRLRARGQALFTVMGYGVGGVLGLLGGGAIASRFGFVAMFLAAALMGALAAFCARKVEQAADNTPAAT